MCVCVSINSTFCVGFFNKSLAFSFSFFRFTLRFCSFIFFPSSEFARIESFSKILNVRDSFDCVSKKEKKKKSIIKQRGKTKSGEKKKFVKRDEMVRKLRKMSTQHHHHQKIIPWFLYFLFPPFSLVNKKIRLRPISRKQRKNYFFFLLCCSFEEICFIF